MIRNISLENFKCFEHLELELAPLTIITGINGMGKSSVIQSLLLLRQSFDERYLQVDKQVLVKGELVNLVSGDAIRYAPAKLADVKISIDFDGRENIEWVLDSATSKEKLAYTSNSDDSIYKESLFDESFAYLYAERVSPQEAYVKSKERRHQGRLGTRYAELAPSLLYSMTEKNEQLPIANLKHKNADGQNIYTNVSAWLSEIVYEGVQVKAEETDPKSVELQFSFTKDKLSSVQKYSPVNVAFGFSYVLPVILGVLTAKPGSLLIIENPEAHLHPAAQSKIGKLLALAAQNGVQIIIETHSDHLVNGVRVMVKGDEVFGKLNQEKVLIHFFNSELDNDFDKRYKRTLKVLKSGKLDGWPKGFFDEWEKNLRKIIG
jgi:predicted ATPase